MLFADLTDLARYSNFLPDTGLLRHVKPPAVSSNVRMETGFETGDEISVSHLFPLLVDSYPATIFLYVDTDVHPLALSQVFYDPLIAKLIVHGSSRTEALRILRKALGEYQIVGPHTNIEFLKRLAEHESFIREEVETGFITVSLVDFWLLVCALWGSDVY